MRHGMGLRLVVAVTAALFGAACLSDPGHAEGEKRLSSGQTVYVPAYQSIAISKKPRRLPLTTTLSIRNTDPERQITIVSVKYFAANGYLIKNLLEKPETMDPLAVMSFVPEEPKEKRDESETSFIVIWKAVGKEVSWPIIQTVMIGAAGQQGISFVCDGQVVRSANP
ncbi:MAG TPA: DUF3124 domain-containing protein [Syntrophobacteria bacterium]|nr:DUF3124 domain-containing protein [Syntrophobacteria bacterium]